MKTQIKAIRPFIGAKDFQRSRAFYSDLGFIEKPISTSISLFVWNNIAFYLQNAYVKDWVDHTMIFFEVDDVEITYTEIKSLELDKKYPETKLVPIRKESWGSECFLHDPSGILLHFGMFG